jgi:hypothetical protein
MPCGRRRVIHIKNKKLLAFVDQCAKFVDADTVHLKLTDKRPPPPPSFAISSLKRRGLRKISSPAPSRH